MNYILMRYKKGFSEDTLLKERRRFRARRELTFQHRFEKATLLTPPPTKSRTDTEGICFYTYNLHIRRGIRPKSKNKRQ